MFRGIIKYFRIRRDAKLVEGWIRSFNKTVEGTITYSDLRSVRMWNEERLGDALLYLFSKARIYEPNPTEYKILERTSRN